MTYPPIRHVLRDLGIELTHGPHVAHRVTIPTPPETRAAHGGVRIGVLASAADVVAARLAMRSLEPDWLATSDLSIWTRDTRCRGPIVGEARVLRTGRTTTVVEVEISEQGGEKRAIALAALSFVRIKRPDLADAIESEPEQTTVSFATETSGLTRPFRETVGIETIDANHGVVRLAQSEYTINSFGSLQGGMVAALGEFGAETAATAMTGQAQAAIDIAVRYLAKGPTGPYETHVQPLRVANKGCLLRVVVQDAGSGQEMAVITAATIPVSSDLTLMGFSD